MTGPTIGQWYRGPSGDVAELIRIEERPVAQHGLLRFAVTTSALGTVTQRLDVWQQGRRLATEREIADTIAEWAALRLRMSQQPDTRGT